MDNIDFNGDVVPLWCSKELADEFPNHWVDPIWRIYSNPLHQTEKKMQHVI